MKNFTMIIVISVQDPYPDPDTQKYADPKGKNQPKTAKKNFVTHKTQIRTFEKKREFIKFPHF